MFSFPVRAQSSDWNSVEHLAPATSISVVKRGRQGCEVVQVTDAQLTCDRRIGGIDRTLTFERSDVREVRLELPSHNHMIVGAIIGAAVGGLIGVAAAAQSSDPETRGYSRAYGIPIGALVGGVVGHSVHGHGAVIYRGP